MIVGGVELYNREPQTARERGFVDVHCRKEQKPLVALDFGMLMINGLMI
jgi:hypothetical protein